MLLPQNAGAVIITDVRGIAAMYRKTVTWLKQTRPALEADFTFQYEYLGYPLPCRFLSQYGLRNGAQAGVARRFPDRSAASAATAIRGLQLDHPGIR